MLLLHLIFAGLALGAALDAPVLHEKSHPSAHAGPSKRVEPDTSLPIRIYLTQSNLEAGHDQLMRVSDPDSEDFGRHWTREEVMRHFRPTGESKDVVKAWLEASGIDKTDISESKCGGWLEFDASTRDAERLLATEFHQTIGVNGVAGVYCDMYHVPAHLSQHIDFVTPGVGVTSFHKQSRPRLGRRHVATEELHETGKGTSCALSITPACIRALYNIPATNDFQNDSGLGIFEIGDTYDQEDLDLFFEKFATEIPLGTHPKLVSVDGGTAPTTTERGGQESIIDLTLAFSLLYPQNVTLFQTSLLKDELKDLIKQAADPSDDLVATVAVLAIVENMLDAVDKHFCNSTAFRERRDCGTAELTPVLSVSYGLPEIQIPVKTAERACHEYMKLALMGYTVVFSSGDYGPGGNPNLLFDIGTEMGTSSDDDQSVPNACINAKDPKNGLLNGTVFSPGFPASCPYVLSVGGTQLDLGATQESVMHLPDDDTLFPSYTHFGSSGGFSNYFRSPKYQAFAVNEYLTNYKPDYKTYDFPNGSHVGANGGIYNTGGRAFPDVAANGAKLANYIRGRSNPGFGTSLSAPIWASLITRINNERKGRGKGPVGFVNPTLYKNPQIFNDITSGNAPGCGTEGFSATPGWDPTTGLGTPNYHELLKVFLALP